MALDFGSVLSGASLGGQLGKVFGPWGAGIGGAIGAIGGGLFGRSARRKARQQAARMQEAMLRQASEQQEAYLLQVDATNKGAQLLQKREEFAAQAEDLARKQLNQEGVAIDPAVDESLSLSATRKRRESFFKTDTSTDAL